MSLGRYVYYLHLCLEYVAEKTAPVVAVEVEDTCGAAPVALEDKSIPTPADSVHEGGDQLEQSAHHIIGEKSHTLNVVEITGSTGSQLIRLQLVY